MRKVILVIFWLSTGAGCHKEVDPDCVEKPLPQDYGCYYNYQPVCGCNDKTYGNSCEAEGHGITKYTPGECGK